MGKPNSKKRKGPKSTRSGCLMCKPHKHERAKDGLNSLQHRYKKAVVTEKEQTEAAG